MNRELLISYSLCYSGNYQRILNAIRENENVPERYAENAITILDDEYPDKLKDRGEEILLVGISYDKDDKEKI